MNWGQSSTLYCDPWNFVGKKAGTRNCDMTQSYVITNISDNIPFFTLLEYAGWTFWTDQAPNSLYLLWHKLVFVKLLTSFVLDRPSPTLN